MNNIIFLIILLLLHQHVCMDTWDIPYERKAVPMVGGTVSAPLGQCSNNFDTEDESECVSVDHDVSSGEWSQSWQYEALACTVISCVTCL